MNNLQATAMRALNDYAPFLRHLPLLGSLRAPPPRFRAESGAPIYGMIAEFDTVPKIYTAAEQVRDAGYKNWDVYAPFPIHGIEKAMGHKRTRLPLIVACGGFSGATLGFLAQWWISSVDYPILKQGKPFGAWEPFTPIVFELGVLFAAFSALFGMLMLNGLPRWNHPLLSNHAFLRVSDDKLVIAVETIDPTFDPIATRDLLKNAGATHIELVEEEED